MGGNDKCLNSIEKKTQQVMVIWRMERYLLRLIRASFTEEFAFESFKMSRILIS